MLRRSMEATRQELADRLESYYRSCDRKTRRGEDGTVRADGPGGVTWIGLPVLPEDFADPDFEPRLLALSAERMPTGELCPLELLPAQACADSLRDLLDRLQLRGRGHVEVYSLAA
jgi:hypothetical protein